MKATLLIGLMLILFSFGYSQTTIFHENFELPSGADSVSSFGTPAWAINTTYYASGAQSIKNVPAMNTDTVSLVTNSFSTIGLSSVMLNFSHICKLEHFDNGEVEVSIDGGISWTKLNATQYLGTGQFATLGNRFTATAYPIDWDATSNSTVPTNSWWKNETFDISSVAGNKAQVKVRFILTNGVTGSLPGPNGAYGWLIDNVTVIAAPSELIPPTITMVTAPSGSIYGTSATKIDALITDVSGIDTARLVYTVQNGTPDTVGMIRLTGDTFRYFIPFPGFGRNICYKIIARDASGAHNVAYNPSSNGCTTYTTTYSAGGTTIVGTGTLVNENLPLNPYYGYTYSQTIYKSSYFNGNFGNITKISYYYNGNAAFGPDDIKIYMGTTSNTAFASTSSWIPYSNLTLVYTGTLTTTTTPGWIEFTLQTPFAYSGANNLVVAFDENTSGYHGSSDDFFCSTIDSDVKSIYFYNDTDNPDPISPPTTGYTLATTSTSPNTKFYIVGTSSLTRDLGVNQIVYPTGGVAANTNFNVDVKLKNFGTDTIFSATINWKLDGVLKTPFSWTGQLLKDSTSASITIGSLNIPAGNHTLEIWSENPNGQIDLNWGNDLKSINFFACANLLAGNYTLGGTNPDFATFADALTALTQCGITAPVTINVAPGTYTGQMVIPYISGSSATNTVTFKSANSDSTSVILQYDASATADNFIVRFNGASYITFKGLTFKPIDSTFATSVDYVNNANNIKLLNNVFIGTLNFLTNNDQTLVKSLNTTKDSALTISYNRFMYGYNGVAIIGPASTDLSNTIVVKNNIFNNQYRHPGYFENIDALDFGFNEIKTDSSISASEGIYLKHLKNQWKVYNNKITLLLGNRAINVWNCNSTYNDEALVYNNMISVGGPAVHLVDFANGTHIKFYYNTFNRYSSTAGNGFFVNETSGTSDSLYFQNNIFANNSTLGYAINFNFALGTKKLVFNNNNYFTNSATLGKLGSDAANFAAWKVLTTQDQNSLSVNPYFTSNQDLHVLNNMLNGAAQSISGITTDIDGETRNATTPDIGADEFTPSPYDIAAIELVGPISQCGLGTQETIKLKVKNVGSATVNGGFTASYQIVGSSTIITENASTTINPGDTGVYTFTTKANLDIFSLAKDSIFKFVAWVNLSSDPIKNNDTINGQVTSGFKPSPPIVTDTVIPYGTSANLYPQSTSNILWYNSQNSTQQIYAGVPYNTGNLYDTTMYYVEAKAYSAINATIGNGTSLSSAYGYPTAFENYWYQTWQQYLFTKAELNAMGISAGNISSIAMNIATMPDQNYFASDYNIKIGTTTNSALSTFTTSGLTNVYGPSLITGSVGWNTITFTTPFVWDGVSNIIIDLRQTGAYGSGNATTYYTTTTNNSVVYGYSSSNNSNYWNSSPSATTSTSRPNIKFAATSMGLCASTRVPLKVSISGYPQNDAGLLSVVSPIGSVPSGTQQIVKVKLKNYGIQPLTSVIINRIINNVPRPVYTWTGNLAYKDSIIVNTDTIIFNGGLYTLKAYTSLPNTVADTINLNDTTNTSFKACLNGTYTIGDTTGGIIKDFPSFTAAKNALQIAGVCGSVIFNVDTGTYAEQVKFDTIPGASSINTITFQSANGDSSSVILVGNTSLSTNYVLQLNGAKYLTFKGITIKSTSTSTGYCVSIINSAKYNTIKNCRIIAPTGTSTSAGIYTTGTNDFISIINNKITNGYYGIYLNGSYSALSKGAIVDKNTIEGFYYYGAYLYYQDSMFVMRNTLKTLSNFGSGYGIYSYNCNNNVNISYNKVFMKPTGTVYGGIYSSWSTATATKRGLIANNFVSIYGSNTSGAHIGIYNYYNYYYDIIHNSVNIAAGNNTTKALQVYYGGNNVILNNNLKNTANGYSYYVDNASAVQTSNHNNIYTNGANYAYWGSAKANLAALQSSSLKDSASLSVNVAYIDSMNLHLLSTALSSKGLYSSLVPDDIDGEIRSSLPTIGADEVPLIPIDGGVASIILSPSTGILENDTVHVKLVVSNYGTSNLSNFPVSYKVNGGNPVTATHTATLVQNQSDTLDMPYFISPAGNSSICAKTSVPNDTNLFNDEYCKSFFGNPNKDVKLDSIVPLVEGCGLGIDSVRIKISNIGGLLVNGSLTAYYQVVGGSTIVSQAVTDSISIGSSIMFKFNTPINLAVTTSDSTFKIKSWISLVGDNVHYNDTILTTTKSLHIPPLPITSNVSVPYGSPATVNATSTTNDSILWYDALVGGNKLIEANSYTTGLLYTTDTLYAEARAGLPAATVYTGTGTTVNANTSYPTPYGNYWWGSKEQYLITKAELNALGVQGGPITSLAFDVDAVNSCPALDNFYISLGHSSTSAMTAFVTTGMNTVYSNASYQPVTGWNTHTFSSPFIWNGNDNIIVEVCFNNSSYVSSGNAGVKATTTAFASVASVHGDNATNCTAPGSPSFYSVRPNMKLIVSASGCSSNRAMAIITVAAPTAIDAGILAITAPVSSVYMGGQESVKVNIRNFGTSPMSNFQVSYKVDNNTIVTETVAATIPSQGTLIYTFATKASFAVPGTTYSLKTWTSLTGDMNHSNDTVITTVTNLLPNYCVSAANYSSYYDIENVNFAGINNTSPSPYTALYTNYTSLSPGIISGGNTYPISISTNFNSSTTTAGYLKVFIDYNRDGVYTQPDEVAYESAFTGIQTLTGNVIVPANVINGQTQMRIVARYNATATTVLPCGLYDYGETEDYMMMISPMIPHDASVEVIHQPISLLSANTPMDVKARIKNIGSDTIFVNQLSVNYKINGVGGTAQTNASFIKPGDTMMFTFTNVSFPIGYSTLCITSTLAGDSNLFNNELCKTVFGQFVSNIPYCDGFDATSDYWYHADTVWQRGIPGGTTINTTHSAPNVYKTSLNGVYPNNANISLLSPQFNFSGLGTTDTATLSVWYAMNAQSGSDYGLIEYSTTGGASWSNLTYMSDPASTNGYTNNIGGIHCWSGAISWSKFSMKLDPTIFNGAGVMQFRFRFVSNGSTNNNDGFAIDDFCIDVPQQQIDAAVDSILTPAGSVGYGTNQTVTIRIKNAGATTLTSIPLHYRINNAGAQIIDLWTGNLAAGATANHTFATNFAVPTSGSSFTLTARVNVAGDGFAANDSMTNTITINPPAKDAGITQIIEPLGGNDTTCFGKAYQIKVTVKNFGTDPITSMNIQYSVNGVVKKTEPWTGNLAPGATVNYTFTDSMVALTGFYAICVKTILPNDVITTNDQVCKNLIGHLCIGMEEKWDAGFTLEQNIPNPSRTITKIGFETPVFGTVKFNLTNVLGQTVQSQTYEFNAGRHVIDVNTSKLAEGVYYYSVELEGHRLVKKMIVVK